MPVGLKRYYGKPYPSEHPRYQEILSRRKRKPFGRGGGDRNCIPKF